MPLPAARSISDFAPSPFFCLLHVTMSITDLSLLRVAAGGLFSDCFAGRLTRLHRLAAWHRLLPEHLPNRDASCPRAHFKTMRNPNA